MSEPPREPEFSQPWDAANLVRLPPDDPARESLPPETFEFLTRTGLPQRLVFLWEAREMELSFLPLASGLKSIRDEASYAGLPEDWSHYWILGDEEFGVGGAWWCLDDRNGHVLRIDLELDDPVSLVNTSVPRLSRCLLAALDWARSRAGGGSPPAETQRLAEALRRWDPHAAEAGFWAGFLIEVQDEEDPLIDLRLGEREPLPGFLLTVDRAERDFLGIRVIPSQAAPGAWLPAAPLEQGTRLELRRPDGSTGRTWLFDWSSDRDAPLILPVELALEEVPPGTQIWLV